MRDVRDNLYKKIDLYYTIQCELEKKKRNRDSILNFAKLRRQNHKKIISG